MAGDGRREQAMAGEGGEKSARSGQLAGTLLRRSTDWHAAWAAREPVGECEGECTSRVFAYCLGGESGAADPPKDVELATESEDVSFHSFHVESSSRKAEGSRERYSCVSSPTRGTAGLLPSHAGA